MYIYILTKVIKMILMKLNIQTIAQYKKLITLYINSYLVS